MDVNAGQRADAPTVWPLRHQLAGGILIALMVLPVFSTMAFDGNVTNSLCFWLLVAFNILLLPDMKSVPASIRRDRVMRVALIVSIASMFSWFYFPGPFLLIPRFHIYIAVLVFYYSISAWFRLYGERAFTQIYLAKSASVFLVLLIIAAALIQSPPHHIVNRDMPIYWHIRHLNFDLLFVTALGFYFWARTTRMWVRGLCAIPFLVLGYFTAWSGGRGGMLALLLLSGFLLVTKQCTLKDNRFWLPWLMLLMGGLLVPLSGQAGLLMQQLARVAAGTPEQISSGRIGIWLGALHRIFTSPEAFLFGYGPDAFVRLGVVSVRGAHPMQFSQPHNAIVQWLLEFGLMGTLILLALYGRVAIIAVRRLYEVRAFNLAAVVSALLLALFVYAQTDGLLYHLIPLIFVVLLCAYLCVSSEAAIADGARPI